MSGGFLYVLVTETPYLVFAAAEAFADALALNSARKRSSICARRRLFHFAADAACPIALADDEAVAEVFADAEALLDPRVASTSAWSVLSR